MEAPTCRICLARHWSHEPHVFTKDQIPPDKPKPMTPKERKRIIPQDDGTALFVREAAKKVLEKSEWDGCPHCAERRAKDAARVKKWREKKK